MGHVPSFRVDQLINVCHVKFTFLLSLVTMPKLHTALQPRNIIQSTSPSPPSPPITHLKKSTKRNAAIVASKKIENQAGNSPVPSPSQKDSGDEVSPPSLSDTLKMGKFTALEIVASDESLQEVLRVGDWLVLIPYMLLLFNIYVILVFLWFMKAWIWIKRALSGTPMIIGR
jgi:hypothetical protein